MTRHEILCEISRCEWLLNSFNIEEARRSELSKRIEELTASLAQFHEKAVTA